MSAAAAAADSTQADSAHPGELDGDRAAKRFSLSGYQLNKLPGRRLSRSESQSFGYGYRAVKLYKVSCRLPAQVLAAAVLWIQHKYYRAQAISRLLCRSQTCRHSVSRWRRGAQASSQQQQNCRSLQCRHGTAMPTNRMLLTALCNCSSVICMLCRDFDDTGAGNTDEIDELKVAEHYKLSAASLRPLPCRKLRAEIQVSLVRVDRCTKNLLLQQHSALPHISQHVSADRQSTHA